jgi:hypothetical protein
MGRGATFLAATFFLTACFFLAATSYTNRSCTDLHGFPVRMGVSS